MALELARKTSHVRPEADAPVVGRIVAHDADQGILVSFPGQEGPSLPARTTVLLTALAIERAIARDQPVLLVFEQNDVSLPIIVGLVQPVPAPGAPEVPVLGRLEAEIQDALIDGRRVVLEACEQVELRCGKASILLQRNGKIVLRGEEVVSHSSGRNRIRGGSVEIN